MPSHTLRLSALAVALLSLVASASVIVFETLDDMARRVPLIVRGHVARSVSGWDDQKHRIWTWTEFVVSDPIKGKPGAVVLVKQPGGEVENIGQTVAGAAQFKEGEECVLFLEAAPDEKGAFAVSGLSAGKISLTSWQGQPAAIRNTDGISFARPGSGRVEPVRSPEFLGSPDDFVKRIRAAVGGAR
jgi:hypothetical protein